LPLYPALGIRTIEQRSQLQRPTPPLADKLTSALRKLEGEEVLCARARYACGAIENGDFDDFPARFAGAGGTAVFDGCGNAVQCLPSWYWQA
jgi:hypothetical protein